MKVVLVNPGYHYDSPYLQITEPLGVLYLASYVRRYSSHDISVVDCLDNHQIIKIGPKKYWYGLTHEQMLGRIGSQAPDVIGVSCLFSKKKEDFFEAARSIKKRFPTSILVAGGTYPSLSFEEVIRSNIFQYCMIGEAEDTFTQLLNTLESKGSNDSLNGVAFLREDGALAHNPKTKFIDDLDSIPTPARDLINYESYLTRKSVLHGMGLKRVASILTSRSCPNRCNFCSMYEIHGPRWRARNPEAVVDEIAELNERYNVQEFFIMDDNFTFKKKRVMEFCEALKKRKIKIRWNTPNGISVTTLDKEVLVAMKEAGCVSICIAIETGDEELRNKVIGKRLSNAKIEEVARIADEIGLFTSAFYIIGMPGETRERFERTLHQIKTIPLNGVAAAFANPLPGTELYEDCFKNDWTILQSDEAQDNVFYKPYIVTKDFSEEELLRREKEFYRTFIKARFFTIIKDAVLMRNGLLYPPFLMRIVKDRLFRS